MKRRFLPILFKNYAVLVVILTSIELIGHLTYRIFKDKFLFQNDRQENILFKEHPNLVGVPKKNFQLTNTSGDIKITMDQLGHRRSFSENRMHDEEAINVVCLGGSTTFATGVSDQDSWPYLLQEKLGNGYKVTNLGVPGYSTLEAIIQLATTVPGLKPDIIISYQGWNDIKNYGRESSPNDYYEHGMSQRTNLKVARKKSLTDYSFLVLLSRKIRSKIFEMPSDTSSSKLPDDRIDSIYVRNLKTARALGNHLGAKQIFIPQVLNLEWFEQRKGVPNRWTEKIPNEKMPELLKKFNALMYRSILSENNVVTIDSILHKYDWKTEHFVDEGHFSREGGDQFTDIIIEAINRLRPVDGLDTQ